MGELGSPIGSEDAPASARRGVAPAQPRDGRSSAERIPFPAAYVLALSVLLLGALYAIFAATVLPGQLRSAARRAGVRLDFGSLRSIYPGDLHLEAVELSIPGAGLELHAAAVDAAPRWRSLFSTAPPLASAHASQVDARWANQSLGPFELRVETLPHAGSGSPLAWVAIDAARARLALPGASLSFALEGRLRVPRWDLKDGALDVELGEGSLAASSIRVEPASGALTAEPAGTGMRATLSVEAGVLAVSRFGVIGSATARGPDAGVWLDLADADADVRWMLAELVGAPFQLQARFRACSAGADFRDLRFESGITRASGALHVAAGLPHGALMLRRGSLALGVSLGHGAIAARLTPEPYWLDAELERQRPSCPDVMP